VIAPRDLPPAFAAWNHKWGAPSGRDWRFGWRFRDTGIATKVRGPFAHQKNAETRRFEYPWAHDAVRNQGRRLRIVEIGGGLAGMQFVLASEGDAVINVDPGGQGDTSWGFAPSEHERLCRVFRAPVRLIPAPLEQAGLEDASADVVLCVSVLEHLSAESLRSCLAAARRVIRPEGAVVLTVDLFLDLAPFTKDEEGPWGRNVSVRDVLEMGDLELVTGNQAELLGFPDFDPTAIRRGESRYLVSTARSVAQCLIAKPKVRGSGQHTDTGR